MSNLLDHEDSDELKFRVASEMRPDESLVWVGRPSLTRFQGEITAEMVLGMIVTAFVIGVPVLVRPDLGATSPASLLPLAAFVGFGCVGVYLLMAPRRYRRVLGRTIYAITTRRAFMVNGFGHGTQAHLVALDEPDRSFGSSTIRQRELKRVRSDGSGDIIFDIGWSKGRRRYKMEIGFFGVIDITNVDGFLARLAR